MNIMFKTKDYMKKDFHVRFKYAEIYHFSRCLGIDKVPERGNNPLGMECNHFKFETIDITKKNVHLFGDNDKVLNFNKVCTSTPKMSKTINSMEPSGDEDNESIHSVMSIDYTPKSLQPMNPIQRKKCLEGSGVVIDRSDDVHKSPKLLSKLRETRKQVGCKCSNIGKCDSSKCICSSEGIPCQSDGNKFPCKCGDKCSNTAGKRVYSFAKIKYHYSHTLNRNPILNEDLDLNILSTTTGDCPICDTIITEETWTNCPEPYHQTRSRKRAGDDNAENIKLFKPMMTIEENDGLTNRGSKGLSNSNALSEINPLSSLRSSSSSSSIRENAVNDNFKTGIGSDAFSYSFLLSNIDSVELCKIPSPTVLDDSYNKENIKSNQNTNFDILLPNTTDIKTDRYLSTCSMSNKFPVNYETPLRVEIPNATLISPCSSATYHQDSHLLLSSEISNSTHFNSLPIISTPISKHYYQSFLNNESSFNDNLTKSPPLIIKPSPLRFNPVDLAPSLSDSMDKFFRNQRGSSNINNKKKNHNKERSFKEVNQIITNSFNYIESLSPESILSDKTSTSNEDNLFENLVNQSIDRSNENPIMTTKMKQLHLNKCDSDPILLNVDCATDRQMKSTYSIRPIRSYKNLFESPTKHICKRKTNNTKSSKTVLKKDFITPNLQPFRTGTVTNVKKQVELENFENDFRNSLEITFFDIPLLDDENEKIDSNLLKTQNIK